MIHSVLKTLLDWDRDKFIQISGLATPLNDGASGIPTPAGSRMLVLSDGSIVGTIGGGKMEKDVIEKLLIAKTASIVEFNLSKNVSEGQYLCGGRLKVLIEPLNSSLLDRSVFSKMERVCSKSNGIEAVRLYDDGVVKRMIVDAEGSTAGTLGDEALDAYLKEFDHSKAARSAFSASVKTSTNDDVDLYIHHISSRPLVVIFGGGHCGQATAEIAYIAGFSVIVVDDRDEFAQKSRFPFAECIVSSLNEPGLLSRLNENRHFKDRFSTESLVVIMTHGHKNDHFVMMEILNSENRPKYIGIIGSRAKANETYSILKKGGFGPEVESIVHCPIGLRIPGGTAGEIAVSVVGQLLIARYGGDIRQSVLPMDGRKE